MHTKQETLDVVARLDANVLGAPPPQVQREGVTVRWRALLRSPVVDGFADVEIWRDALVGEEMPS